MHPGRTAGWTRIALVAAVALAYFAAARFGLGFAVVAEQVTVVWPSSGIALAALLVLGFQAWPGVWLGALAANALAHEGLGTALAIAVGNTMEAVAGAWLLRRVRFHEGLGCPSASRKASASVSRSCAAWPTSTAERSRPPAPGEGMAASSSCECRACRPTRRWDRPS